MIKRNNLLINLFFGLLVSMLITASAADWQAYSARLEQLAGYKVVC